MVLETRNCTQRRPVLYKKVAFMPGAAKGRSYTVKKGQGQSPRSQGMSQCLSSIFVNLLRCFSSILLCALSWYESARTKTTMVEW